MMRGATTAPRMPQTPAAVSTRPIDHGAKPPWISRRVAATNSALTTRLEHMPQTISVRKNGRSHANRMPSAMSARARRRLAGRAATGDRSVRIRPSSTQETANVTRVEEERQPARHGVQRAAERAADQAGHVLAGLLLATAPSAAARAVRRRAPPTSRPARTARRRRRSAARPRTGAAR